MKGSKSGDATGFERDTAGWDTAGFKWDEATEFESDNAFESDDMARFEWDDMVASENVASTQGPAKLGAAPICTLSSYIWRSPPPPAQN